MKKCVLAERECNNCGACEDRCEFDPNKICDNCFKCLDLPEGEYMDIPIAGVYLDDEFVDEDSGAAVSYYHYATLSGCCGRFKHRR